MAEKMCIKWSDFAPNISNTFSGLRYKKDFVDVTLVSNDHHQISAHKVILSACSGYFETILTLNTHTHPLLCLNGINSIELNLVMDYIYNGEILMYQQDLERFLEIAERLELKGLLIEKDDSEQTIEEKEVETSMAIAVNEEYYNKEQMKSRSALIRRKSSISMPAEVIYRCDKNISEKNNLDFNNDNAFQDKVEPNSTFSDSEKIEHIRQYKLNNAMIRKVASNFKNYTKENPLSNSGTDGKETENISENIYKVQHDVRTDHNGIGNEELNEIDSIFLSGKVDNRNGGFNPIIDSQVKQLMEKLAPGRHKCKKCEYTTNNISHIREHIEDRHLKGLVFNCDMCGHSGNSRSHIRKHKKKIHGGSIVP